MYCTRTQRREEVKFGLLAQILIQNFYIVAILLLYLPIAVGGYAVYGDAVAPNVSASLAATPLTLVGNVLMAVHLVFAFIILINPVCQEMEELYNVPHGECCF